VSATAEPRDAITVAVPERVVVSARSSWSLRVGVVVTGAFVLVGVLAPVLAPAGPFALTGPPLEAPGWAHPFGTDALGRDLLDGVVHGTRTSLVVSVGTAGIVLLLGLLVGMVSGYVGGRTDDVLMRATEFVQVLPRFFLALVVIALFGPGIDRLVVVLGVTSWPLLARVVRSEVLGLRHREFVEAARADGATTASIVGRELLPNVLPVSLVYLGLVVAQVLLVEAGLGFLGLGDPNQVSLGFLASQAQQFLRAAWWMSLFPGAAIVCIGLGMNLLADGLGERAHGGAAP
jgi:peptide/nickel transport system permease protein